MLDIFCLFEGKGTDYSDEVVDLIHSLIEANIALDNLDAMTTEITREVDELLEQIKQQNEQLH